MLAELGNFFVVVPFMTLLIGGMLVIFMVLRERRGPTIPNLTARRKHPLRHLQVELNKAKRSTQEQKASEDGAGEGTEDSGKARPAARRGDGPRRLRRLK